MIHAHRERGYAARDGLVKQRFLRPGVEHEKTLFL